MDADNETLADQGLSQMSETESPVRLLGGKTNLEGRLQVGGNKIQNQGTISSYF